MCYAQSATIRIDEIDGVEEDWDPNTLYGDYGHLSVTFRGSYRKTCDVDCTALPPLIRLRIDCDHNLSDETCNAQYCAIMPECCQVITIGAGASCGNESVPFELTLSTSRCECPGTHLHLDTYSGYMDENCQPHYTWHCDHGVELATPPIPQCPWTSAVAGCFSEAPTSPAGPVIYKSEATLTALRADAASGVSWSEGINGEFVAPKDGTLRLSVQGTQSNLNVAVSPMPGADGWLVSENGVPIRMGTILSDFSTACQDMEQGQKFMFNVLGGKADGQGRILLTFMWYERRDEETECHLPWLKKRTVTLPIDVRPVRCIANRPAPAMPELVRVFEKVDGQGQASQDFEFRLPCCSGDGECAASGHVSDSFVAWPAAANGLIRHGHLQGWKVSATPLGTAGYRVDLTSPGPNSLTYHFEP